jgi:hypothetical protein
VLGRVWGVTSKWMVWYDREGVFPRWMTLPFIVQRGVSVIEEPKVERVR